jgi:hypothetical protein
MQAIQLKLFEGDHIPMTRCLAALASGDVAAARVALSGVPPGSHEAVDAARLGVLEAGLEASAQVASAPASVHAAFARALTAGGRDARPATSRIGADAWFRLYAGRMIDALCETPETSFRGWRALHFALAAGCSEQAQQQADRLARAPHADGRIILEVARATASLGAPERARRLVFAACLREKGNLDPAPPRLEADEVEALNAPSDALPRLPDELETLFEETEDLELPAPTSAWVPALGMIEALFPSDPGLWPDAYERAGFDPHEASPPDESAPRAFLSALLAARRARRETPGGGSVCGEAELRARATMRDAAPALFARYLVWVRGASFFA